jgi:hypothetical protein
MREAPSDDDRPAEHVVEHATIHCPQCGHRSREVMPAGACLYFYECGGCGAVLKPRRGDCCVFCSYSERLCPPVAARFGAESRTLWSMAMPGGRAELRLHRSPIAGWSLELYMNGRFLVSQRCASEEGAKSLAAEIKRAWAIRTP